MAIGSILGRIINTKNWNQRRRWDFSINDFSIGRALEPILCGSRGTVRKILKRKRKQLGVLKIISQIAGSHTVLYETGLQFICSVVFDITGYMDTHRLLVYSAKNNIAFSC